MIDIFKKQVIKTYMVFGAWVELVCEHGRDSEEVNEYLNKNILDKEFLRLVSCFDEREMMFVRRYVHKNRVGVLPGWEWWGVTPSGNRIYRSTEEEVIKELMDETSTCKENHESGRNNSI